MLPNIYGRVRATVLNESAYKVATLTREEVDGRNLDHGIATRLLTEHGTSARDENLTSEGGVVNLHEETEILVGCGAADAVADEVDTMANVVESLNRGNLDDVGLIVSKIVVGLDGSCNVLEFVALFELHINHATMDASAEGYGHREGILNTRFALDTHGVTHGTTGTKIGVGETFGRHSLHDGADHGVGTWIPTSGDDGSSAMLFGHRIERVAEVTNLSVDIEGVYGCNALSQDGFGGLGHGTSWGAEERNVHLAKLGNILNDLDASQFTRLLTFGVAANYASQFHIGSDGEGLDGSLSDVAVAHYSNSLDFICHFIVVVITVL